MEANRVNLLLNRINNIDRIYYLTIFLYLNIQTYFRVDEFCHKQIIIVKKKHILFFNKLFRYMHYY